MKRNKMRIGLIGTDWNVNEERKTKNLYGGVTYYRLIKPLFENENDEFEFFYHGADMQDDTKGKTNLEFFGELMKKYDAYVIKGVDNPSAAAHLCFFAQKLGKKVILDLDDNMFEVKKDQPAYKYYYPGSEKRAYVGALISLVDGLFVSTQPLKDYFEKFLKERFNKEIPIYVLPNYNDKEEFKEPSPKKADRITIGWVGSTTHNTDIQFALPAINRIMKEYPNVYFELLGGIENHQITEVFKDMDEEVLPRVYTSGGTLAWKGYPELLASLPWDIGIAPLTECEFNRAKSHIKWMEYAMMKVPCVASKVYPYYMPILDKNTIVDGETGFLASTEEEWYDKLKSLIESKELREKIGQQAYDYVAKNLQYKDHQHLWISALSEILWEK